MISSDDKSTPRPWKIYDPELESEYWIGVDHPEWGFISHAETRNGCEEAAELGSPEANARLIVTAVNSFPALEKAREAIAETLKKYDALPPQIQMEMMPLGLKKLRKALALLSPSQETVE